MMDTKRQRELVFFTPPKHINYSDLVLEDLKAKDRSHSLSSSDVVATELCLNKARLLQSENRAEKQFHK